MSDCLFFTAPSGRSGYGGDRSTTSGGYGSSGGFAGMIQVLEFTNSTVKLTEPY